MTTNVRVDAHCASDVEVEITVYDATDDSVEERKHVIQDGQSFEDVVHGTKTITVCEKPKPVV